MSVPLVKLTLQEIYDFLDGVDGEEAALPDFVCLTDEIAQHERNEVREKLALQLLDIKLDRRILPDLRKTIREKHYRSLLPAGEPCGIRAAEGIGAPITQSALSSFHQSGSATAVSTGIDAVKELYNVTRERKNPVTTIHFKNKNMSFEDVIEARRSIVGCPVKMLTSAETIMKVVGTSRPYWYKYYASCNNFRIEDIDDCVYFLRLVIKTELLYAYRVTMKDICTAFNSESTISYCIPSPAVDHTIDIFPNRSAVTGSTINKEMQNDALEVLALEDIRRRLSEIVVSEHNRIKSISQISPVVEPTFSIVSFDERYFEDRQYKVWIDPIKMRLKGIPFSKLNTLFKEAGIEIKNSPIDPDLQMTQEYNNMNDVENDVYVVKLPEQKIIPVTPEENTKFADLFDRFSAERSYDKNTGELTLTVPSTIKVVEYIDFLLKLESARLDVDIKRQETAKKIPVRNISKLFRAGHYVYARARGSHLRKVLAHPLVDSRRSTCNDFHEMCNVLGIEAVRNAMVLEYHEIVQQNDSYVTNCHIEAIAAFQTSLGYLMAITSDSVARSGVGAFSLSSFDKSMDRFTAAAAAGSKESTASTSTSIFVGRQMKLGTGAVEVEIDAAKMSEAERKHRVWLEDHRDEIDPTTDTYEILSGRVEDNTDANRHGGSEENGDVIYKRSDLVDFAVKQNLPEIVQWPINPCTYDFINEFVQIKERTGETPTVNLGVSPRRRAASPPPRRAASPGRRAASPTPQRTASPGVLPARTGRMKLTLTDDTNTQPASVTGGRIKLEF